MSEQRIKSGRLIMLQGPSGTGKTSQWRTMVDVKAPFGPGSGKKRLEGFKPLKGVYASNESKYKSVQDVLDDREWPVDYASGA